MGRVHPPLLQDDLQLSNITIINNIIFPQTAKDRFNLATLAVGNNKNLNVAQFVSLYQKEIESNPHFYGDKEMEDDMETLPTTTDSAGAPWNAQTCR